MERRRCGHAGRRAPVRAALRSPTRKAAGMSSLIAFNVFSGILNPLKHLFLAVLEWLHYSANLPWAWAIVVLTVIVRIVIVPLTVKQIHSMQSLQAHAPEMKEIQQRYKHDKQRP